MKEMCVHLDAFFTMPSHHPLSLHRYLQKVTLGFYKSFVINSLNASNVNQSPHLARNLEVLGRSTA